MKQNAKNEADASESEEYDEEGESYESEEEGSEEEDEPRIYEIKDDDDQENRGGSNTVQSQNQGKQVEEALDAKITLMHASISDTNELMGTSMNRGPQQSVLNDQDIQSLLDKIRTSPH